MKRAVSVLVCLVSVAIVYPCSAADSIKVGIVDSYSGPATAHTFDILDGFKLAVTKANAKGVLGRKIEFTTRDDKFKPDIGLTMAKELIMKENVDILVGTINSATTLAVSDFVKKEKVPFFVTGAKSEKITGEKGHRYVFSTNENTRMIGRAAAIALAKKPFVKYWIAGEDYEFGHAYAEAVWNDLKELKPGVQLAGQSWWKVGESDIVPYLTAILQAKPDCIIGATGGAGNVNFMKSVKAMGLNQKVAVYHHNGTEVSVLGPLGLDAPVGIIGTAVYHSYFPETPENKAFVEEFKKAFNKAPRTTSLAGYITGMFIARGYEKAGKFDREALVNALEGLVIDSPVGKAEMRACDHQVVLPMFAGVTKISPGYEFLIATDIITIPGKDLMPSCEFIKKIRQ
ncbi:MAG TPA: ABC transporter substrate-binding protein [Syntrophorhabdales bacterium]|nr:ABC transporter substrate-binding protein [Syntrophorhabdales bacterium]